jgi:hypothetical protein
MTFDDDFVLFQTEAGPRRVFLKDIGKTWPPPARIDLMGFPFVRERMSEITDEQRADMTPRLPRCRVRS